MSLRNCPSCQKAPTNSISVKGTSIHPVLKPALGKPLGALCPLIPCIPGISVSCWQPPYLMTYSRSTHCSPCSLLLPRNGFISSQDYVASLLILPLPSSIAHPHLIHSFLKVQRFWGRSVSLTICFPGSKLRLSVTLGIKHKLLPVRSDPQAPFHINPCSGSSLCALLPHSYLHESPTPSISSSASALTTGLPVILFLSSTACVQAFITCHHA